MKEQKFNKIIAENGERIQRICKYYTSNPQDQEDIYQEILINIWRSLDRFRGDASLSTWIYRIAVNTSLTFRGKVNKDMPLLIDVENSPILEILTEDEDNKALKERQFQSLELELNQLSVIDKTLISLLLEGQSSKEIANIIGITEPNVKVKIHRIKSQLKEKLK